MPNLHSESKTPISSSSRKSVFLWEWWLIKVGSKLGVGGFCNRETLGSVRMRLLGSASSTGKKCNFNTLANGIQVFGSPAISKRLNYNTLEAVDGTIITISGCINRSCSVSYGFSHEVCDRFLSGFPFTWEDDYESSYEKCGNTNETSLHLLFDDVPVTRVRDILMSATGESETRALNSLILRDIQKQCCKESLSQRESSRNSDEVSRKSTEKEVDHNNADDGVSLLNPTEKITEDSHKVHSFPVDLHEKDLENNKEAKDEHKHEETMSAKKRPRASSQKRYPLRSTRRKENT